MKKIYLIFLILIFSYSPLFAGNYEFINNAFTGGGDGGGGAALIDLTSCMGAWFMNADGGLETDRSGESGTLSEIGSVPRDADIPSGYSGYSRYLSSSDLYYLYHNDGLSTDIYGADQQITFMAWIRFTNLPVERYIASKGAKSSLESWRFFATPSDNRLHVILSDDGTTSTEAIGGTTISAGTWYHAAFVYDDTDIRIYLNGALDSNGSDNPRSYTDGLANTSQPFYIGRCASYYTSGEVDEVAIFNTALTAEQINGAYTNGISGNKGGDD
jgi:hypothetical protein